VSKIEIGRWSEQLRRMLGQKGVSDVAGELSPEISPTIQLEGPTADWAFLKHVRLAGSAFNVAAGAGFRSVGRIVNPVGSSTLALFTLVGVSVTVATQVILSLGNEVNIGGVLATTVRDSRWTPLANTSRTSLVVSVSNSSASGGLGVVYRQELANLNAFQYREPFLLLPGDSLDVFTLNINTAIQVSLAWEERQLPVLEE